MSGESTHANRLMSKESSWMNNFFVGSMGQQILTHPPGYRGHRHHLLHRPGRVGSGFWGPGKETPWSFPPKVSFLVGLLKIMKALVYLVVRSSTRAIYFPRKTPPMVQSIRGPSGSLDEYAGRESPRGNPRGFGAPGESGVV